MGKFRFYHIDNQYIEFLHKFDRRVQFNKGGRPYIGVVLKIGEIEYFAPLESPKPNHSAIKSGGPVLKIDDGTLGIIGFNNMIPISQHHLVTFDINDIQDKRYRVLLLKQLSWCNDNNDLITRRAQSTYTRATVKKIPSYLKSCCDFKALEKSAVSFKRNRA